MSIGDELPPGWSRARLSELVRSLSYGFTASAEDANVGPRLLRITDLQNGTVDWSSVPHCKCPEPEKYLLAPGDIVVARTGATTGKSYLITSTPEPAVFASYLIRLSPASETSAEFVAAYMKSPDYWRQITQVSKGTAQPGANASILGGLEVPLPPLNEQRRIVAKLEALLARSRKAKEALEAVPALLERFRQSVLASAFRGDLTRDWREKNPNVEPASKLLQHLGQDHRKKLERPEPADPEPLPGGWAWAKMEDLVDGVGKDIFAGPFGTIFKAKDFRSAGVPIIFLRHVAPGRYLTKKPGFMDEAIWKERFREYSVSGGELLVTKLGEPPGVAAIYPSDIGVAMVTPDVIAMRVSAKRALTRFLMHYLNSDGARRIAFGLAFGSTRLRLTIPIFRAMAVPLPPIKEQVAIVEAVELAFSRVAAVENACAEALTNSTTLDQAILAKAFRGELVPQDPSDEPASVLLERIKAERERPEQPPAPKKTKSPRSAKVA